MTLTPSCQERVKAGRVIRARTKRKVITADSEGEVIFKMTGVGKRAELAWFPFGMDQGTVGTILRAERALSAIGHRCWGQPG